MVYLAPLQQFQLSLAAPTLDFLLAPPRLCHRPTTFRPDQLDWPPSRRELGTNSPVMTLDSLIHINCNSHVERTIPAFQHVTEPDLVCASSGIRLRYFSSHRAARTALLDLFVRCVLPARIAKFRRLEPVLMLLPVLRGRVVAVLTIAAL